MNEDVAVRKFERWGSREPTTWPFQVFKRYTREYERMFWAQITSKRYVYKQLGETKAGLSDDVEKHFNVDGMDREKLYKNIEDWTAAYNQLEKWTFLNGIMAISANLETYMVSAIKLALESDPGVMFSSPRSIDGAKNIKFERRVNFDFEREVISCTKGEWFGRVSAYKKIFGKVPNTLVEFCGELDEIRKIRNSVGHAFGRDIEGSRDHSVKNIMSMGSVSLKRAIAYKKIVWRVAQSIDRHLLAGHIGEYQILRFYHIERENFSKTNSKEHMVDFRKAIGRSGAELRGRQECEEIVEYYSKI